MTTPLAHGTARPLVVGAPRTGFSLLIHVLNRVLSLPGRPSVRPAREQVIRELVPLFSDYATRRYLQTIDRCGETPNLVFNGEFHRLVGGPKWIDKQNPDRACFRKYVGLKGQGDFLLITSHPREVMEFYDVIHSHTAPALWLQHAGYRDHAKFASVRNPIGVINSSCFSLNAMASEYLQRFLPQEREEHIRQRHGLYKLTDLEFVRGLVKFLKTYLDEFLPVLDRYFVMKWEDLINSPVPTIQHLASGLGLRLSEPEAQAIWKPMDHVNLLEFHKHNYRRGKGIVGDWKNSLVNEHMELFREFGFDDYLQALGYPPIPTLDPRDYSPYQKLVAAHLQRGEVYRNTGDPDLFGFAFNKTNIDASKFNFKSFPKREWTHVERTTLANDALVLAFSDTAEDVCAQVNRIFACVLSADWHEPVDTGRALTDLHLQCRSLVAALDQPELDTRCAQTFDRLRASLTPAPVRVRSLDVASIA